MPNMGLVAFLEAKVNDEPIPDGVAGSGIFSADTVFKGVRVYPERAVQNSEVFQWVREYFGNGFVYENLDSSDLESHTLFLKVPHVAVPNESVLIGFVSLTNLTGSPWFFGKPGHFLISQLFI